MLRFHDEHVARERHAGARRALLSSEFTGCRRYGSSFCTLLSHSLGRFHRVPAQIESQAHTAKCRQLTRPTDALQLVAGPAVHELRAERRGPVF